MTAMQPAVNPLQQGACPGPIPKTPAHAARCRACGKCAAIANLLNAARSESTLMETAPNFSPARLQG